MDLLVDFLGAGVTTGANQCVINSLALVGGGESAAVAQRAKISLFNPVDAPGNGHGK